MRDVAAVGVASAAGSGERVHVAIVVDPGIDPDVVVALANARLEPHQAISRAHLWPQPSLPRTDGTGKLKRAVVRDWVRTGAPAPVAPVPAIGSPHWSSGTPAAAVSPRRRRSTRSG